ncbi:MAG: hypothetical protein HY402_02330 [Elusimicrobia bacterium]|nr:hypothetical protein [Elusimicrobiota bacterium]
MRKLSVATILLILCSLAPVSAEQGPPAKEKDEPLQEAEKNPEWKQWLKELRETLELSRVENPQRMQRRAAVLAVRGEKQEGAKKSLYWKGKKQKEKSSRQKLQEDELLKNLEEALEGSDPKTIRQKLFSFLKENPASEHRASIKKVLLQLEPLLPSTTP